MKRPLYKFFPAFLALSLLLAACGGRQSAPQDAKNTGSDHFDDGSTQDSTAVNSADSVFVTDVEGTQRNLTETPWAKKYPSLLDAFIGKSAEELTGYVFYTIAPENRIAKGTDLTCNIGSTPVTVRVDSVVKGAQAEGIPADKLQEAVDTFGALQENQEYLSVSVSFTNNGSEPVSVYLNSLLLRCCVDGTVPLWEVGNAEAVANDLPGVGEYDKNGAEAVLAAGETQTHTILFCVNGTVDVSDLYLYPNLSGAAMSADPKEADQALAQTWLALA